MPINDPVPNPQPTAPPIEYSAPSTERVFTRDELRAILVALLPELIAEVVRDNGGRLPGAADRA